MGCGTGSLWIGNAHRVPDDWEITLSDFSPGMLQEAQRNLGERRSRLKFEVIDAQSIPFEAESFDAAIAILVMQHVPDLNQALSEIHRVLRPGGRFLIGATGRDHMRELRELINLFGSTHPWSLDRFSLETGPELLSKWFREIALFRYEDSLKVTETQPLLDYVLSMRSHPVGERWSEFVKLVEREIDSKGSIYITKDVGVFDVRKARVL